MFRFANFLKSGHHVTSEQLDAYEEVDDFEYELNLSNCVLDERVASPQRSHASSSNKTLLPTPSESASINGPLRKSPNGSLRLPPTNISRERGPIRTSSNGHVTANELIVEDDSDGSIDGTDVMWMSSDMSTDL